MGVGGGGVAGFCAALPAGWVGGGVVSPLSGGRVGWLEGAEPWEGVGGRVGFGCWSGSGCGSGCGSGISCGGRGVGVSPAAELARFVGGATGSVAGWGSRCELDWVGFCWRRREAMATWAA